MDVEEKWMTSLKITSITPRNQDALGQGIKWVKESLELTITCDIQIAFRDTHTHKKSPHSLYTYVGISLAFQVLRVF